MLLHKHKRKQTTKTVQLVEKDKFKIVLLINNNFLKLSNNIFFSNDCSSCKYSFFFNNPNYVTYYFALGDFLRYKMLRKPS